MSHKAYTPEQEQQIIRLRVQEKRSLPSLVEEFGGTLNSMRNCLRRHGVAPLSTGRPRWREFNQEQVLDMAVLWQAGLSQTAIAQQFGTTQHIVSRLLARLGITVEHRPRSVRGEKHGQWRGGRVTLSGYTYILLEPGSPFMPMANGTGYIAEHRLVMAQSLGRCLLPSETVHHINGNRLDNRLENLQLRRGKHGNGVALRCADCGSHNLVEVGV